MKKCLNVWQPLKSFFYIVSHTLIVTRRFCNYKIEVKNKQKINHSALHSSRAPLTNGFPKTKFFPLQARKRLYPTVPRSLPPSTKKLLFYWRSCQTTSWLYLLEQFLNFVTMYYYKPDLLFLDFLRFSEFIQNNNIVTTSFVANLNICQFPRSRKRTPRKDNKKGHYDASHHFWGALPLVRICCLL